MTYEEYQKQEQARIDRNIKLMEAGVNFIDIRTAYIDEDVVIGKGTTIYPNVCIEGSVRIGTNCTIGPNTTIEDSIIGDATTVQDSVILDSFVGDETSIGPFAYLRPKSKVGNNCKVGDFVEIKNSTLGDKTKSSHHAYIGDADVGSGVNVGCGVVFVNFNGSQKFRSKVDNGAFLGCNANLLAPVHIGEKAYIAAGSTVSEDVEAGALYIERNKSKTVKGWVAKKGILIRK